MSLRVGTFSELSYSVMSVSRIGAPCLLSRRISAFQSFPWPLGAAAWHLSCSKVRFARPPSAAISGWIKTTRNLFAQYPPCQPVQTTTAYPPNPPPHSFRLHPPYRFCPPSS